jgi:CubicO group peptidase (beta-lactamase class C family)
MTSRKTTASLLCSALFLALFASGCQQDAAREAEEASATDAATDATAEPAVETRAVEPPPPPTPVPGTDAAIVQDNSTPVAAVPTFDAKAFAGRYAAGDTALEITADGMFALTLGGNAIDGTWTLQADGKTVTLDPDSKSETDRQLQVVSADSVKLAGTALKRVADKQ